MAIAVVSILFLYGYIPGLSPTSVFGAQYGSFFGSMMGATGFSALGLGPLVPGGVAGLIGYTILTRVGSVTAAATAPSMSSPEEMMRRMSIPAMFGGMGVQGAAAAAPLPADITRSQFVILQHFRQGYKNPKEIGKALSMDKSEVGKDSSVLKSNGYLSKDGKLTSKAMELLGR